MKKTLLALVVSGLGMGALSSSVQAQNMTAVNSMLSRQNMNFQMHQMMMNTMNMSYRSQTLNNYKATYLVEFKDSTFKQVHSKILYDFKDFSYLELIDKSLKKDDPNRIKKIFPSDTRSIKKLDPSGGLASVGIPADSCWLFKEVEGKINGYTFLPSFGQLHSGYFSFVQKGKGPLVKLDKEALLEMVEDNEKAKRKAVANKWYEAMLEYNKEKD